VPFRLKKVKKKETKKADLPPIPRVLWPSKKEENETLVSVSSKK
jgi:hypothetical protein